MGAKKILIFGARGMLGTVLCEKLRCNSAFQVLTHSQTLQADFTGDLSSCAVVERILVSSQADFCVNTMALTDVNIAEIDCAKAYQLNVLPAQNLVKVIQQHKLSMKLIQISTDHVYDKNDSTEKDIVIVNNYARTKYDADKLVEKVEAVVLRTNFFGTSVSIKKSFSDWIIENLQQGKRLQGFKDVYFSPLHIGTLCSEIERVILHFEAGAYNLGSRQGMSKYDFMLKLAQHKNLPTSLISATAYVDAEIPIPRPRDMRMNVSKYERIFSVRLPTLLEEIQKC